MRNVSRAEALGMGGQRKVAAFIDLAKATPTVIAAGITKARFEIRASGPGNEPHVRIDQVPLSRLGALATILSKLTKRVPQSPVETNPR